MKKIIALNNIASFISKNPLITILVFILGTIGSIMTIISSRKDFLEFISIKFEISIGTICLILILIVIFKKVIKNSNDFNNNQNLITIEGKKFGVERILLDGKKFVNCKFDGSELIFEGKLPFTLEKNEFTSPPRISFHKSAGLTFNTILNFYKSKEFKYIIEESFGIKGNTD